MAGMSQGSAYPEYTPTHSISPTVGVSRIGTQSAVLQSAEGDEWQAAVDGALARVARIEAAARQLNERTDQRGRSWSLPVEQKEQARVPVWTSRKEWLRQFRHHTTTPAGKALCARNQIRPDKAYVVAEAHAHFAESHTGRGVCAAKSTIAARAKVSESSVNRTRRVLIALGMGIEHVRGRSLKTLEFLAAEAHHGGQQHRAASTWSLSSPQTVVATTPPQKVAKTRPFRASARAPRSRAWSPLGNGLNRDNPPNTGRRGSRGADTLSSVGFLSSKVLPLGRTHQRVHARTQPTTKKRSSARTPRPLALQTTAAELINHAPALRPPGHIGVICDLLRDVKIDTTRWTGRDIALTLSRDTADRGWTWPARSSLSSPLGYLRRRLEGIDWTRESPSEQRKSADLARKREQQLLETSHVRRSKMAADPDHRARSLASIRAHLSKLQH